MYGNTPEIVHSPAVPMQQTTAAYFALAPFANKDTIAYRRRQPIDRATFVGDVRALAARLPAHSYVVNLCSDRYRFTVGLAAALCRGQISLLPPNDIPVALKALMTDYRDSYCLTDGKQSILPCMIYPDRLDIGTAEPELPMIAAEQPAIVLFSSGSTGRPKSTTRSWGVLVRSAVAAGKRLGMSSLKGATVIGTVPHQHSYGLESTILLALQNGLAISAERPFYPVDIRAALDAVTGPRILVTTPFHLRALLADAGDMPRVDLVISATAPLPAELASHAEKCFGAPLMEIYGCTETGQIATRRTATEDDWRCLDGIALKKDGHRYSVSGPLIQARTMLPDAIDCSGNGRFHLRGRLGDTVKVAGKHASLAQLNSILLGIDGVQDGVFLMPEEETDRITRLIALVVAPGLRAETVLTSLREQIDAAFLPRPLIFVNTLPHNELGKLPRETLLRIARRGNLR